MWKVYGECMVYGDDFFYEYDTEEEAEEFYNIYKRSEEYLKGWFNLYLFKELKHDGIAEKLNTDEYDFIPDAIQNTYYIETGEFIKTKRKKFKAISDERWDYSLDNRIKEDGFKKGDVGILFDERFSLKRDGSKEAYSIIKNTTKDNSIMIDTGKDGDKKRESFIEISDEEYWEIREKQIEKDIIK